MATQCREVSPSADQASRPPQARTTGMVLTRTTIVRVLIFPTAESRPPCCATWNPTTCRPPSKHAAKLWPAISKPKLEDYLAHCEKPRSTSSPRFSAQLWMILVGKTLAAAEANNVATLFVTGGVAANQELRQTFEREAAKQGLPVYFPSRPLSTDNAAMIAAAAYPKFLLKDFAADGLLGRGWHDPALN